MSENTFYNLLKKSAEKYPDDTAILYDTHAITYSELFKDSCKKAVHFKHFDKKRIALIGPASYRWVVNFFGAVIAGKDVVLLDSFLADAERRILLDKVRPDYILSSTMQYILADSNAEIIQNVHDEENCSDAEAASDAGIQAVPDTSVPEGNILFFTSGTSELAKAVVLTSENLNFSTSLVSTRIHCDSSDRVLSILPLNHVFGLVYSLLWPLSCGACVCISRGIKHIGFDTIYYLPSILPVVPAMLEGFIHLNALNEGLKTIVIGESHCPSHIINELEDDGYTIYSVYGLTAASGGIAVSSKDTGHELVPYDDINVYIASDGEIFIKSRGIMNGYDNDDEETAKVLTDGYLHSGDLGHMTDDGHLIITGSKKNILALPNGEKINCLEVEEFFNSNSSINETALGLLHGASTIWISTKDDNFKNEQAQRIVNAYNKSKCVSRHINHFVIVRTPLPRDASGQLDRWALADMCSSSVNE